MSMMEQLQLAVEEGILRSLDIQFANMVAGNNQPALMLAAALVSRDAGEGHVCLPLSRLSHGMSFPRHPERAAALFSAAAIQGDWHTLLLAGGAVSEGEDATPLKLAEGNLYLHRMWRDERTVAAFFQRESAALTSDESKITTVLNNLFNAIQGVDWQKVAAAVALTRSTSVISGGPGTGKTTTVAKLLAALIQLSDAPLRIQLAAPTGKAAARLTESLGAAMQQLPLTEEQKRLVPSDASTLHRLLGAQPGSQKLRYHAGNPLHLDVLVVDEASMVDLPMMARLVEALVPHARVIFLGDRDQLASVEAGAVLGDLCQFVNQGYSPARAGQLSRLTGYDIPPGEGITTVLGDSLALLRKSYRFDGYSGIGLLAAAVNRNDRRSVEQILDADHQDLLLKPVLDGADYRQMIQDALQGYQYYLDQVAAKASPDEILKAFSQFQLLCALRAGPFGVEGLNQRLEQLMQQQRKVATPSPGSRWYEGRPVMISTNDSALGLFNGDIGVALDRGQGIRVWFPLPDGTIKSVLPNRLPAHDTAWVMTVHKSQGSEFNHAALVLPDRFSPVVTRELVYTAITRARKQLSMYADRKVLFHAITQGTERRSGLAAIFSRQ